MSDGARAHVPPGRSRRFEAALLTLWLMLFVYVAVEARSFATAARLFPQTVSYVGIVLTVLALWRVVRPRATETTAREPQFSGDLPAELEHEGSAGHPLPYLVWTIAYFALIALVGFFPATAMFVATFLITRPGVAWLEALLWTGGVLVMAYGMGLLLQLRWPGGLVMRMLGNG